MQRTLGIGVIGLGHAGSRHARALARGDVPGARLEFVCDPKPERRAGFGVPATPDPAEMLVRPSVDAVIVATPHPAHLAMAGLALRAGRRLASAGMRAYDRRDVFAASDLLRRTS